MLVRLALCAVTALLLWAITRGWAPPLPYHWGDVPQRDIVARTEFEREDPEKTTQGAQSSRGRLADRHLRSRSGPARAASRQGRKRSHRDSWRPSRSPKSDKLWNSYRLPLAEGTPEPTPTEREQQFQKFRETLSAEGALDKFKAALNEAFAPLLEKGVIEKLPPEHDANKETISVHPRRHRDQFRRGMCRSATC